jgi:uncharacterized repeat protein (TIGR02543 family)
MALCLILAFPSGTAPVLADDEAGGETPTSSAYNEEKTYGADAYTSEAGVFLARPFVSSPPFPEEPNDPNDYYSVRFMNDGYGTRHHNLWWMQYVAKASAKVQAPSVTPETEIGNTDAFAFLGWYKAEPRDKNDTDSLGDFTLTDTKWDFASDSLTDDLWLYTSYGACRMVYFLEGKEQGGQDAVADSQKVLHGDKSKKPVDADGDGENDPGDVNAQAIAGVKMKLTEREVFENEWYKSGVDPWVSGKTGIEADKTKLYGFDETLTSNLHLKPLLYQGYYVYFDTMGTPVDAQTVKPGGHIASFANPTRTGYTFQGWKRQGGGDFDLTKDTITADTVLEAKWTGEQVAYTVVYWLERANIPVEGIDEDAELYDKNNYVYAYHRVEQGTAGEPARIDQVTANQAIHSADADSKNSSLWYAEWHHSQQGVVIDGTGTTIVNVYCTRKLYNLEFHLKSDYSNNFKVTMTAPNVFYKGTYNNTGKQNTGTSVYTNNAGNKYTIYNVKHGLYLENVWPIYNWIVANNLQAGNPYPQLRYMSFNITDGNNRPLSGWTQMNWEGPSSAHSLWYNRYAFDMNFFYTKQNRPTNNDTSKYDPDQAKAETLRGNNNGGWRISFYDKMLLLYSLVLYEVFDEDQAHWANQTVTADSPVLRLTPNGIFVHKENWPTQPNEYHQRHGFGMGGDSGAYNYVSGTYYTGNEPSGDPRWPGDQLRSSYRYRMDVNDGTWPEGPVFLDEAHHVNTNAGWIETNENNNTPAKLTEDRYYDIHLALRQRYRITYFTDGGVMNGELGGMIIPDKDIESAPNAYGQVIKRSGNQVIITVKGDDAKAVQAKGVQYGRPLGGMPISDAYPNGLLNFTPGPGQISKEGYRFLGWYSDPEYRNLVPTKSYTNAQGKEVTGFNFNMPAGPAAFYARWESADNTAEFYDGRPPVFGGGGKFLGRAGVANGKTLSAPTYYQPSEAVPGKGVFLGWYYKRTRGTRPEAPYPFEMSIYSPVSDQYHGKGSYDLADLGKTVNEGEFDEKDYKLGEHVPVLLLFAKWQTEGFKIEYKAGTGAWKDPGNPVTESAPFNLGVKAMVRGDEGKLTPPSGAVFVGWTLSVSGQQGNDLWLPGAEIAINGDAVFTARYVPAGDIVTMTYNSNADPAAGAASPNLTEERTTEKNRYFHPVGAAAFGWADAQGAGTGANAGRTFLGWSIHRYAPRPDNPQTFRASDNSLVLYAVWNDPNPGAIKDFVKSAEDSKVKGSFKDDVTYPAGTEDCIKSGAPRMTLAIKEL